MRVDQYAASLCGKSLHILGRPIAENHYRFLVSHPLGKSPTLPATVSASRLCVRDWNDDITKLYRVLKQACALNVLPVRTYRWLYSESRGLCARGMA